MVPRTSSGRGFKGAAAYYLHDKGAATADRVRFTQTLNLANDNPQRAVAEMIYTAEHASELKAASGTKSTGRKLEKPVYVFSLSWHPTEKPTDQHMQEAGLSALRALKMDHHQVLMVAHKDTAHAHIHLIVNRIDAETGRAHGLNKDQLILSRWAQGYEAEHGKTWCADRVRNNADRAQAKGQGRKRKFVKDLKGQERDARPEFDRRAKAAQAKRERKPAAPTVADRRTAVEEGKAAQINALQDRHNEERAALGILFHRRMEAAKQAIEDTYGPHRRQEAKRLAHLERRQRNGSGLSKLVDRVRGFEREVIALRRSLETIKQRSRAIEGRVVKDEGKARAQLAERQEREKANLEASFSRRTAPNVARPGAPNRQDNRKRAPRPSIPTERAAASPPPSDIGARLSQAAAPAVQNQGDGEAKSQPPAKTYAPAPPKDRSR